MWTGYTPSSRQSTLLTSPIAGPSISPTSTYPPEIYASHRKSLSKVIEMDDTPSSSTSASTTGAQLVARDYALHSGNTRKDEVESETEEDSFRPMSPRKPLDSPIEEGVGGSYRLNRLMINTYLNISNLLDLRNLDQRLYDLHRHQQSVSQYHIQWAPKHQLSHLED